MSVNQTLLDFRVTPDASGNWMKSVGDKIREILKESCHVDKPDFSGPAIMLFSGQHGMWVVTKIIMMWKIFICILSCCIPK